MCLLSLMGSYFNAFLMDSGFHLRAELPFLARWIAWMLLTVPAISLAGRQGYRESKPGEFVWYHIAVVLLLSTVHIFTASVMATGINAVLRNTVNFVAVLRKCALASVFFDVIIYTFIVLAVNWSRNRDALHDARLSASELQQSLTESQLMFLRQQLQPHFLFNTHHSILTLIRMGEKEKAARMLERLSELMRLTLYDSGEQKITLEQELGILQLYLDIQQIRFEHKMAIGYSIEDSVSRALVPGMILQPIVENAIKYAVERSSGRTNISICAAAEEGRLKMCVRDSGSAAVDADKLVKGVGLTNTTNRLQVLYGGDSGFSIGPYGDSGSCGTEVTINIPLQYA